MLSPKFARVQSGRYSNTGEIKENGETYTPKKLADFVATQIAKALNDRLQSAIPLRVLDPAVGDGELLMSLLTALTGNGRPEIEVFGFDTRPVALERASNRLAQRFPAVRMHLSSTNFLEFVEDRFPSSVCETLFGEKSIEKFDVVIANPPYVRTQVLGALQAKAIANRFALKGRVDLYHAFVFGISQLLKPRGIVGIIVSNRFMTTNSGASVRQAFCQRFKVRHVWDLGDTKLFSAAVLPAVLLLEGLSDDHQTSAPFVSIYETSSTGTTHVKDPIDALAVNGIVQTDDGRNFLVQHGNLNTGPNCDSIWSIGTNDIATWLATVSDHTWKTFGGLGKVRVGVKTCADEVFIRADWERPPSGERPELLRPLTTHHIARRFKALERTQRYEILYPHEAVNGTRRAVDISKFPRALDYLEKHRKILEGRKYLKDAGRQWFEIWVPQQPALWGRTKLVFRDIAKNPTFWIDQGGTIVNGDCYWIVCDDQNERDLIFLACAVANSTFIEAFYDRRFCNKLYAGRRRFMTQYVEQFPLPNPYTGIGEEIIQKAKTLFEVIDAPQGKSLEVELNRLVWLSFGLPVEEIPGKGDL
jgi:methylase of polypeptide subunit release factors